jgi:hypothetical protein
MKTATLFIPLAVAASVVVSPLPAQVTPTTLTQPIVNAQAQNQAPPAEQRDARFRSVYGNSSSAPAARAPQAPPPPAARPVGVPVAPPVAAVPAQPSPQDARFRSVYGSSASRGPAAASPAVTPGAPAAPPVLAAPVVRREDPEREQRIINFQRQNAISGNPSSQYDLGMRYVKGDGVEQDDKQALEWLKLSAKSGHGRAKKELAALEKRLAEKGKDAPAAEAPVAKAAKSESE